MQHAPAQEGQNLEMSLREHLLAAGASGSGPAPYPAASAPPPTTSDDPYRTSDTTSPQHDQYDQHTPGQAQYGMSGDSEELDGSPQSGKGGKRELSTSKRAAQNRAAQRAFRQRKEGYIKKLEEQVKEFETLESNFRALQSENYQLREYILNLQSRLLENSSDFPPAPAHANLPPVTSHHIARGDDESRAAVDQQLRREMQHQPPPTPDMRHDGMSQLQAAAQQASEAQSREAPYGLGTRTAVREDAMPDAKPSS